TKGWFEFDFWPYKLTYYDIDGKPETIMIERVNLIADEFKEFGECILTGKQPETGGPEARAAVVVMQAALESARTGKLVKL
ncbi:MAG: gfo/Idh/MocA family oxidoreductase, partial [Armatimonadota bacterium]|nr:gfo/Idh/MocA family oxidoreductase [Armatimonadota bacterium]